MSFRVHKIERRTSVEGGTHYTCETLTWTNTLTEALLFLFHDGADYIVDLNSNQIVFTR